MIYTMSSYIFTNVISDIGAVTHLQCTGLQG
jgi:hypothetical protein